MTDPGSEPDRDPVVADALRRLLVPDHRDGFWTDLDRRLTAVDAGEDDSDADRAERRPAERVLVPMVSVPPEAPPEDVRIATGDLPAITILGEHQPPRAHHALRWLSAAAVVVAVATTAALLSIGGGDEADDQAGDAASTPTVPSPTRSSLPAGNPVPMVSAPADVGSGAALAVDAFILALGAGDLAAAADLVGPETREYIESFGNVEGYLSEAQEGVGGWADAEDRTLAEVPIGDFGFGEITLVEVSGTFDGEGEDGFRTEGFPVIFDGARYLVEWQGFDPELGGRPEFVSPRETSDGLEPVPADGLIEVFYPLDGVVTFVLDGDLVRTIGTQPVGADDAPYAKYEPDGGFEVGEHVLSVVFVSDRAVFAMTVPLTVVEP